MSAAELAHTVSITCPSCGRWKTASSAKLYRQGKILGGVYVDAGRRLSPWDRARGRAGDVPVPFPTAIWPGFSSAPSPRPHPRTVHGAAPAGVPAAATPTCTGRFEPQHRFHHQRPAAHGAGGGGALGARPRLNGVVFSYFGEGSNQPRRLARGR